MADPLGPVRGLPGELRRVIRPEESRAHRLLRDRLVVLSVVTGAVWVLCATLMFLFERHASGTDIHNAWQAMYWTASQMTAVGSNFGNPRSTPAYVLDLALKVYAVVIVATLAGTMGAFFIHRREQEQAEAR
jgi:voltage-gated potassium channel